MGKKKKKNECAAALAHGDGEAANTICDSVNYDSQNPNKVFVTSDLHFGHEKIIEYCDRPFANAGIMNTKLINYWNAVVGNQDRVFFLGDFGFGARDDIIRWGNKLNGRKVMVYGNHDHFRPNVYMDAGFEVVSRWPIVIWDRFLLSHAPVEYDFGDLVNIHGHIHNNLSLGPTVSEKTVCACVERWDYRPVELNKIAKLIKAVERGLNPEL